MAPKLDNYYFLVAAILILNLILHISHEASAMLLSDIPTPCFVIDLDALPSKFKKSPPYLHLPNYDKKLAPLPIKKQQNNDEVETMYYDINSIGRTDSGNIFGYFHSSVIRAKEDAHEIKDAPISTFLAEVDLTQSLCYFSDADEQHADKSIIDSTSTSKMNVYQNAQLVLGLNNHHVGSYYWARSAGSGASMEAPGIIFKPTCSTDDRGILRWEAAGGPLECNSNDGKRSEWVNFLRVGDNVQLIPMKSNEQAIMAFLYKFGESHDESRIFGITTQGRPLGSEPQVTCKWVCY